MRVIYEFHGRDPQTSGTGHHYAWPITKPPEWRGFRVEVMGADCQQKPAFSEGDAIYLEGDGEAVKKLLASMLGSVMAIEAHCRKKFEAEKKAARPCKHGNWGPGGKCYQVCKGKGKKRHG